MWPNLLVRSMPTLRGLFVIMRSCVLVTVVVVCPLDVLNGMPPLELLRTISAGIANVVMLVCRLAV